MVIKISLKEKNTFLEASGLIEEIFNYTSRLPEQVFRHKFNHYRIEEFDWTLTPEFYPFIQKLALSSEDPYILMSVLEPDPIKYFDHHFGVLHWNRIPLDISNDEYWNIVSEEPEESPADTIHAHGDVIIWTSPSKEWAIWGERGDEVCILATENEMELHQGSWLTAVEALKGSMRLSFKNQTIPAEYSYKFKRNYGN